VIFKDGGGLICGMDDERWRVVIFVELVLIEKCDDVQFFFLSIVAQQDNDWGCDFFTTQKQGIGRDRDASSEEMEDENCKYNGDFLTEKASSF